jgi:hypothetical protein
MPQTVPQFLSPGFTLPLAATLTTLRRSKTKRVIERLTEIRIFSTDCWTRCRLAGCWMGLSRGGAVAGRGCSRSSARPTTRSLTRKFVPTFCQILETSLFAQSDALARYLRFTVETTLDGKADTLKEYVIGTAVYDRQPSYSPGEDSIVCSEARRLRRKLHKYYGPVATCLPSGR